MLSTHKHILVFFSILGILLVPVGNIMTIQGRFAKGDDSYIYLVDFDETAYDMYIQGYYPTDYTYADFRRDSIEGMVSHYVATDNNNFGAVVDTVENAVINDGWSAIKDFFENAWIDLKSGVVTVEEGFTDDFKHTLDGRFKTSSSMGLYEVNTSYFGIAPAGSTVSFATVNGFVWQYTNSSQYTCYICALGNGSTQYTWEVYCFEVTPPQGMNKWNNYFSSTTSYHGTLSGYIRYFSTGLNSASSISLNGMTPFASANTARQTFFGSQGSGVPVDGQWNGNGYYSDTPTNYSINLPAFPAIDWQSISNNNKTKYGVDFPDVNVSVDFTLPDMYYPKTVTYDVPYWLQNGDETPVDWVNVNFDDVTMPSVDLPDGDGTFFQNIFLALPVGFSALILGAMLCYLIFLLL